jgi:hypothetical protein
MANETTTTTTARMTAEQLLQTIFEVISTSLAQSEQTLRLARTVSREMGGWVGAPLPLYVLDEMRELVSTMKTQADMTAERLDTIDTELLAARERVAAASWPNR